MELDINSKRIRFTDYVYALIYNGGLHKCDLTDTSIDNGINRSWLSKLDNKKSYIPSIQLFYKLLELYIRAHDYRVYIRYMRILVVDSTFIKTLMNGSGSYKGESNGIKGRAPTIIFTFTVRFNAYISSANVNDSSLFDNIIKISQLKIDHLLSKSVNGMIIQAFSYMIAYIIVNMIMESVGILLSFPEIIRG